MHCSLFIVFCWEALMFLHSDVFFCQAAFWNTETILMKQSWDCFPDLLLFRFGSKSSTHTLFSSCLYSFYLFFLHNLSFPLFGGNKQPCVFMLNYSVLWLFSSWGKLLCHFVPRYAGRMNVFTLSSTFTSVPLVPWNNKSVNKGRNGCSCRVLKLVFCYWLNYQSGAPVDA